MGLRRKAGRASMNKGRSIILKTVFMLTVYVFTAALVLSDSQYDNAEHEDTKYQLQTEAKDSSAPGRINAGFAQSLQNSQLGISSALQGDLLEHHSQPTTMSVQGKATNKTDGTALSSGSVRIKVSNATSCTAGVIYDETFSSSISSGTFSLTLGEGDTLWLDFNRDYWMCIYVNSELVSGPTKFRSTGGEVNRIGDASSGTYVDFQNANVIVHGGGINATTFLNASTIQNPTFTSGSVIFSGANGIFRQNITKFYWDDANSILAVGTNDPTAITNDKNVFVMHGGSSRASFNVAGTPGGAGDPFGFLVFNNLNSDAATLFRSVSLLAIQPGSDGDEGELQINVHNGTTGGAGSVSAVRIDKNGNVGIGDTTPDAMLDVAGEIRADGVSGDGTGKVICVKSGGNFGTCSSGVASDGTCTCG
ncbi:MAG: hypothetical protein HYW26_00025 [Candidatus Aenigmarchaeota archaeon]|nr:hypothetical protein [Candidatus Aenigmarchaeota archaeon]